MEDEYYILFDKMMIDDKFIDNLATKLKPNTTGELPLTRDRKIIVGFYEI
jgi:hypothetical protein